MTLLAWGIVAAIAISGCAYFAAAPLAAGPCLLEVHADSNGGTLHPLDPPYSVRPGPLAVLVHGTGWSQVHVTRIDPTGIPTNEDYPGETINRGLTGFPLMTPGMWRFRFEDNEAGCAQEFSVEVNEE